MRKWKDMDVADREEFTDKWGKRLFNLILVLAFIYLANTLLFVEHTKFEGRAEFDDLWFHEQGRYTVSYTNELGELKVVNPWYTRCRITPKVFFDLEEGEKPFYEYHYEWRGFDGCKDENDWAKIHLPKGFEIRGGGWNHGKFGSGQTTRITNNGS